MNVVKKDNAIELWHRRLSHMSEKGMTCLAKKKVLSGMDQVHLENCVDYLKGKQNRVVFKSFPSSIMKNVLELVHSNLCGPMPKSLGGAQYFDQFGYRFYDPVQKKLVRSCDAVFIENQTIEDVDKMEKDDDQPGTNDAPVEVEIEDNDNDGVHRQPPTPVASPVPLRRGDRNEKKSTRYSNNKYVLLTDEREPKSFEEAMDHEHKHKWIEAMQDEMKSLYKNKTCQLMKLPISKKALKNR
ncbi:Retrovirus-related Pol polyprotein from transposon TNT 1-94 [Vitis vinifera]|uniref:Retrovirus-related Pol polyprotein from transposon TNT 1-94 n=1 Tax=Vitis vinifera TaxID=29760 RepID=A0A438EN22_VITVI|nr:Retrovirus-related Pol polyprotein from transposon TNT 1-94 [Vitis vinifera]